jgi:hypothetical protein
MGRLIIATRGYSESVTTTTTATVPKIEPTVRASVDLGYTSPLDISMDSRYIYNHTPNTHRPKFVLCA